MGRSHVTQCVSWCREPVKHLKKKKNIQIPKLKTEYLPTNKYPNSRIFESALLALFATVSWAAVRSAPSGHVGWQGCCESTATEPPTWPATYILCYCPVDLFWERFIFMFLKQKGSVGREMYHDTTCLWALVTSDAWIWDWCLSPSGCPAEKESFAVASGRRRRKHLDFSSVKQ